MWVISILIAIILTTTTQAQVLKELNTTVGLCAAESNTPEDANYEDVGGKGDIDKIEVFIELKSLRLAFNAYHGKNETQTPITKLGSNVIYLAYRLSSWEKGSTFDFYFMGGPAWVAAALTEGEDTIARSDDVGYMVGGGIMFFPIEQLGVGYQVIKISATGTLDNTIMETGTVQIQFAIKYLL